jgi:hypothetical protein
MARPRFVSSPLLALSVVLGLALASVGCKQDLGERCEQPSDCASGYCGGNSTSGQTNAVGKMCSAGPNVLVPGDAGATPDAVPADDASPDASDAAKADAASSDTSDARDAGDAHDARDASDASDAADATSSPDSAPDAVDAGPDLTSPDAAEDSSDAGG